VERGVAARAGPHLGGGAHVPEDAAQLPHEAARRRPGGGAVREHDGAADRGGWAADGPTAAGLDAHPVEHQGADAAGAVRADADAVPGGAAPGAPTAVRAGVRGATRAVPGPRGLLCRRPWLRGPSAARAGGAGCAPVGAAVPGAQGRGRHGVVRAAREAVRRAVRGTADGQAGANRVAGQAQLVIAAEPVGPRRDVRPQGQGL
jgi:hypothetical protein